MKKFILGLIGIFLVISLVTPIVFAAVSPNKGSEVSMQKASDIAKTNANVNAAFSRGEYAPFICPDGWASSENYCGWVIVGSMFSVYILG